MKGQVKYERQFQNTYITVDAVDDSMVESFGGQIVLRNSIQGLAICKIIQIDGKRLMQYDISNCQDITTVYAVKKISFEEILNIIGHLNQIIRDMEGYLMDGLQLVLSPEYIYLDMETKHVKFIFDFSEKRYRSDIVKLGEFFIDRVDHDNKEATEMAYYFFEISQNGNYSEKRMEEYIEESEKKAKTAQEKTDNNNLFDSREANNEYDESENDLSDSINRDEALNYLYGEGDYTKNYENRPKSWIEKLKNALILKKSRNRAKDLPKYEYYLEDAPQKKDKKDNDLGHTVYIGKSVRDRDYFLIELRRNKEVEHAIDTYPFTVGSQKDNVNLYIKDSSVSRIHAKLIKEDDAIYIEDIHSTNGTMVNDLPLMPHEKIRIKRGDIITLGKTEFEFR